MPENNKQPFKFSVSNSAQKAQFCKRSWNRQYCGGFNKDDLADFVPMTTMSKFIVATSRYDCAPMNQNFLASDQIRQYRSDYAHSVMVGLQNAC